MRHRKQGRKLNMDASARKAMFRNMVTSLMVHGRIRTTEARAKELRRFAAKVITFGKKAPSTDGLEGAALKAAKANRVHYMRQARRLVNDDGAITKIFGEYAERFANRSGGYTRVIKADFRNGDNAKMAIIELTEALDASAPKKAAATEEPAAEAPAAAEVAADEAPAEEAASEE